MTTMRKSNKRGLWQGLSGIMCFLLCFSLIVRTALEANASTIDTYLSTTSEMLVSDSEGEHKLYDTFTPPEDVLNPDGSGNSEALIRRAIELNRRESAEGSVLLKNENGVLPLESGANVTLFGIRSHKNLLGSSFGVKAQGAYISLEQALGADKTDFANTIAWSVGSRGAAPSATIGEWKGSEFDFEGAGYTVNPVMTQVYEKLGEKYTHYENEPAVESYDPGEPSVSDIESTDASYRDSFAQYKDAAIVVVARPSAEGIDYLPGGVAEGLDFEHGEPLSLTKNERDAVELAKSCSDKVIVLVSSSSPVEIGTLKHDPDVDAILWIGTPGCYGMLGVADILCGRVSPSGGLFDLFATYNMSAPAMQNMGRMYYSNTEDVLTRKGGRLGFKPGAYSIEAEGIYTGYRYYETRYFDTVAGAGNASAPAGALASDSEWKYDNEVVYGFGYGLSYTSFTYELVGDPVFTVSKDKKTGAPTGTAEFSVKVTNTGARAGKTPVQLYGQAPYTTGGIEKPAISLLNFEKTDVLEPGVSETVKVKADLQYLASFDEQFDNGDGTKGTYVMEPGDYYFAVGNGAHDALNHIMAARNMDASKMSGIGQASLAYKKDIGEDFISKTFFSVSKTGAKISAQLPYADWNYYQPGEVTYLSRSDWAGTYPKQYRDMKLHSEEMIDNLNGHTYTLRTDDDTSDIRWGEDNGIRFYEMAGMDYDDPKWDKLLDQLTLEEAMYIFTFGGPSIPGAESIGTVETYMTENAGNGVAVNLSASKDPQAPWTIKADDKNGNWHPEVFGNAPLIASTFNPELMNEMGQFVGVESLFTGINILWGPGLNTHRHAYNGRNGEYYSEDPVLSGVAAMEFAIGALDYGLVAAPKHLAFNDQETERGGISPYMTEQRAREIELRAYQIAFEAKKYDTDEFDAGMRGLMTSFSKIGSIECTASEGLMTEILANEWGFIGYAVTDIYDDTDLWTAVLNAGTTCFDTRGQAGFYKTTTLESSDLFKNLSEGRGLSVDLIKKDVNLQHKLKEAVHKNIYSWSVSHLMNRYNETTHIEYPITWWRAAYYGAIGVSGLLLVVFAALFVLSGRTRRSREEEV